MYVTNTHTRTHTHAHTHTHTQLSDAEGCQECQALHYRNLGECTLCTSCPVATFAQSCGGIDAGTCTNCPEGTYKNAVGPDVCLPCDAGYKSVAGKYCAWCPSGNWDKCACDAGYYVVDGVCSLCPTNTYRPVTEDDTATCLTCPTQSQAPVGSVSVAACTCTEGYAVTSNGRCRKTVQTMPVVQVAVTLPLSKAQFEAQEHLFVEALASAAGVTVADVSVVSVTESNGRRLLASSVEVQSEIQSADAAAVSSTLTSASLNAKLSEKGLPASTGMTTSIRALPVVNAAPPTAVKSVAKKSNVALIAGIAAAGAVLLAFAGAAVYYFNSKKQKDSAQAKGVETTSVTPDAARDNVGTGESMCPQTFDSQIVFGPSTVATPAGSVEEEVCVEVAPVGDGDVKSA